MKFIFASYLFATILVHGWYDRSCCADHDCHPVACEQITAVKDGFQYRDETASATYFFSRDKLHVSQDGDCHVCLHKQFLPPAPLCVYLPVRM